MALSSKSLKILAENCFWIDLTAAMKSIMTHVLPIFVPSRSFEIDCSGKRFCICLLIFDFLCFSHNVTIIEHVAFRHIMLQDISEFICFSFCSINFLLRCSNLLGSIFLSVLAFHRWCLWWWIYRLRVVTWPYV